MSAQTAALKSGEQTVEIKLAHSPDSDDAFMFYALATHKLATPGYKYTHVLSDIQTLNEAALTETYDITAVSFAAYPFIRDKYILVDCGASFGEGYGPIVVAAKSLKKEDIRGKRIAVPGLKTSAYLSLKLYEPNFEAVVMPFDKILAAVHDELVDAGLLIHEGQLMYGKMGLHKVLDLGIWWQEQTKLPLPLGGNAVRKALGPELGRLISKTIRDSVSYGLEHREDALKYAMQFARDMETELADQFVGMYVNKWTLGYGEKGKQAVQQLITRGNTVVAGDQITFARVRIRIGALVAGQTYTVTTPVGTFTFVATGGSINNTDQAGGVVAGDFVSALSGHAGPFLKWDTGLPIFDAAGHEYVGNFGLAHTITGSPAGTNFFRVDGPAVGGAGVNRLQT